MKNYLVEEVKGGIWRSLHPGRHQPAINDKLDKEKIKEIEEKIADLKARWPAHSVPPSMWQQLEELEEELEEAQKTEGSDNPGSGD